MKLSRKDIVWRNKTTSRYPNCTFLTWPLPPVSYSIKIEFREWEGMNVLEIDMTVTA